MFINENSSDININQRYKKPIVGRSNFALTIFAPNDCAQRCPFCTSKDDYKQHKPNLSKIITILEILKRHNAHFHDIVITGGEPFSDLSSLDNLITSIRENIKFKDLYINTTLPQDNKDEIIRYINTNHIISGVNISRHMSHDFYNVCDIADIQRIKKPIHINCVISSSDTSSDFVKFVNKYKNDNTRIVFREDYRYINFDTLHSFANKSFRLLDEYFGYKYSTNCHVCHTDIFSDDGNIALHRGLQFSSITFSDHLEINDMIIRQDGCFCYDWDRKNCIVNEKMLQDIFSKPNYSNLGKDSKNIKEETLECCTKQNETINNKSYKLCEFCKLKTKHSKRHICDLCDGTRTYLKINKLFKSLTVKRTMPEYTYPCSSDLRSIPMVCEEIINISVDLLDIDHFISTGKYRFSEDVSFIYNNDAVYELCDNSIKYKNSIRKKRTYCSLVDYPKIQTGLDTPVIFDNEYIKLAYNRLMDVKNSIQKENNINNSHNNDIDDNCTGDCKHCDRRSSGPFSNWCGGSGHC